MLQPRYKLEGSLHIGDNSSNPALQVEVLYNPHLDQFQIGLKVVGFMPGGRETEFGLEDPHFIQVNIYHCFFQLGKTELRRLHAITVGNIN